MRGTTNYENRQGKKIEISTIKFPAGGYAKGNIIYAFVFSDQSAYIGITGSSNESGTRRPYERLAAHLRKIGNTQSVMHGSAKNVINNQFLFSFAQLSQKMIEYRRFVEYECCQQLSKRGIKLHNKLSKPRKEPPKALIPDIRKYTELFSESIAKSCGHIA